MNHASLFSGIGGFDLAAQWAGWNNVLHCEINPFCQTILKHYWPQAITYTDVTKTDFTIHRGTIDVLSGGFPCQPFSLAGKRKGTADARHLWPEMLRAIQEIAPRWVVGENVFGLVNWDAGLVFEQVQADLENAGYQVQAYILPACATNAPHRRDRVWFVAYAQHNGNLRKPGGLQSPPENTQCARQKRSQTTRQPIQQPYQPNSVRQLFSHTKNRGAKPQPPQPPGPHQKRQFARANSIQPSFFANATGARGRQNNGYGKPKQPNQNGQTANWQNFPTQPPICGRNDGLPTELDRITFSKWRNESIKGYGNAIVPQVALQIFNAINQYEETHHEHHTTPI